MVLTYIKFPTETTLGPRADREVGTGGPDPPQKIHKNIWVFFCFFVFFAILVQNI